jgi:hypothetical protein
MPVSWFCSQHDALICEAYRLSNLNLNNMFISLVFVDIEKAFHTT